MNLTGNSTSWSNATNGPLSSRLWDSFDHDSGPVVVNDGMMNGNHYQQELSQMLAHAGEWYCLLDLESKRLAIKQQQQQPQHYHQSSFGENSIGDGMTSEYKSKSSEQFDSVDDRFLKSDDSNCFISR